MRRSVSSVFAAVGVAMAVGAYFMLRGSLVGEDGATEPAPEPLAVSEPRAEASEAPNVVTAPVVFEARRLVVPVSGRTEARRSVIVRAQTTGIVAAAPIAEGAVVAAGDVLCRLEIDARAARLADARASLAQAQIELDAAQQLASRGHRAPTAVAGAQAAFDRATAQVKEAEIAIGHTRLAAPFAGVFDDRLAEVGDFLSPGDPCGVVAEVDPVLVVGEVREQDLGAVKVGASARISLADGPDLEGRVRFVQWRANPDTRTFRIEIEAANPGGAVRAGRSARAELDGPEELAARAPTGLVVLDDAGRLGLRVLDADDIVRFRPVTVVEDAPEGLWVAGLTPTDRLIVRGHEYVVEGARARDAGVNREDRTAEPVAGRRPDGVAGAP